MVHYPILYMALFLGAFNLSNIFAPREMSPVDRTGLSHFSVFTVNAQRIVCSTPCIMCSTHCIVCSTPCVVRTCRRSNTDWSYHGAPHSPAILGEGSVQTDSENYRWKLWIFRDFKLPSYGTDMHISQSWVVSGFSKMVFPEVFAILWSSVDWKLCIDGCLSSVACIQPLLRRLPCNKIEI